MSADFTPEKEDYKILTPFKMQVLTNFPYIEADFDALTNYQLLCKVVEYLNNVITNENEVTEQVTSLYNAYVSLQNYVNTYFDNLDVQDEVDTKIDEMINNGTFTELLNDTIFYPMQEEVNNISNSVSILNNFKSDQEEINTDYNNRITSNTSNIATQTARIDNLATLTQGSTTGDAELIDGRTDFAGITFSNIGGNIRSFAKNLFTEITNTLTIENGYYYNNALTKTEGTVNSCTKLFTKPGKIYFIKCKGYATGTSVSRPQIVYDYGKVLPTDTSAGYKEDPIIFIGTGKEIAINTYTETPIKVYESNNYDLSFQDKYFTKLTSDNYTITDGKYIGKSGNIQTSEYYELYTVQPKKTIYLIKTCTNGEIPIIKQNGNYQFSRPSIDYENINSCFFICNNTNPLYINHLKGKMDVEIYEFNGLLSPESYDPNLSIGVNSNIICCGDSLTYGQYYIAQSTSYRNYYNYPYFLKKMLNIDNVNELARAGATTESWWNEFNENINIENAIYILWLGTNNNFTDTVATDCAGDDYTQFAETATGYLGKIAGKIASTNSKLIMINNFVTSGGVVSRNNKVINDIATKYNGLVVDIYNSDYSNVLYHTAYTGWENNVHFNTRGNNFIANLIVKTLNDDIKVHTSDYEFMKVHE